MNIQTAPLETRGRFFVPATHHRVGRIPSTGYVCVMPYEWKKSETCADGWELSLWPYRSLLKKDFVLFFGATAVVIALPLMALLGQSVLWGILPFFAVTAWGLWFAITKSYRSGETLEVFTATRDTVRLVRHTPKRPAQIWETNRYWAQVHLHPSDGPVENYLTLRGGDREVEIGAFLDVSERLALYDELKRALVQGIKIPD